MILWVQPSSHTLPCICDIETDVGCWEVSLDYSQWWKERGEEIERIWFRCRRYTSQSSEGKELWRKREQVHLIDSLRESFLSVVGPKRFTSTMQDNPRHTETCTLKEDVSVDVTHSTLFSLSVSSKEDETILPVISTDSTCDQEIKRPPMSALSSFLHLRRLLSWLFFLDIYRKSFRRIWRERLWSSPLLWWRVRLIWENERIYIINAWTFVCFNPSRDPSLSLLFPMFLFMSMITWVQLNNCWEMRGEKMSRDEEQTRRKLQPKGTERGMGVGRKNEQKDRTQDRHTEEERCINHAHFERQKRISLTQLLR